MPENRKHPTPASVLILQNNRVLVKGSFAICQKPGSCFYKPKGQFHQPVKLPFAA
jgi:hypothetical protein